MATFQAVLDAGNALRDQIFGFSQNGNFSATERDGFSRLHAYYHLALQRFFLAPAYGDASSKYDQPEAFAQQGLVRGATCTPGQTQSQQSYYDAVFAAGESLKAATGPIAKPLKIAPSS